MQLTITWYDTPTLTDKARERLTRKLTLIRLPPRTRRASYTAARKRMERRGQRALTAPQAAPNAPHVLRIYYRSMGGEILCCETVHSAAQASRLYAAHMAVPSWREGFMSSSDALDAEFWPVGGTTPKRRHGARLVVFPSQLSSDEQELAIAA